MKKILAVLTGLLLVSCSQATAPTGVSAKFESIKDNKIELRAFIQEMPKGGELHTHLHGAVYAESWIKWAEQDGLCFDKSVIAIRFPNTASDTLGASGENGCGEMPTMKAALAGNQVLRNQIIDDFSVRDFVPNAGWSGHDQFFATFADMGGLPSRFGDMIAETANLAGQQNIAYLELMHTMELFETILPMVASAPMTGDAAKDYQTLMAGKFGSALPDIVARARKDIDTAMARKDDLLKCGTENAMPGCDVEIRFLNQPVRTLPLSAVYAHTIFGWALIEQDARFVGTNLVAPEDDYIAMRDYDAHMAQLGYLYETLGPRNISLHAGELWLGLVPPYELRDHITKAVHIARAKRIGHGTAIIFEPGYKDLLKHMADNKIMVEIQLTSSDILLGIKGDQHPLHIYRTAGVPMSLSTDDEGVARIDLTHEYVRATREFDLSYAELKDMTYNGLRYAFVDDEKKAEMIKTLDEKFAVFESRF